MYGRLLRNSLIWVIVLVGVGAVVYTRMGQTGSDKQEVTLSEFVTDVKQGRVSDIDLNGNTVTYKLTNSEQQFKTKLEKGDPVRQVREPDGVPLEPQPEVHMNGGGFPWGTILINAVPLLLFGGLLIFLMRQ